MAVVEIGSSLNFANFNQIKLVQIRDKLCSCNCYPCNLRCGEGNERINWKSYFNKPSSLFTFVSAKSTLFNCLLKNTHSKINGDEPKNRTRSQVNHSLCLFRLHFFPLIKCLTS